jgi:hypothetical protein
MFWVAHASGMLVLGSRRNNLLLCGILAANDALKKVRDREHALASTRDVCATQSSHETVIGP